MGIGVLILGHSGSGKSTSLRNCTPDRFGVINVQGKPLPFKSELKTQNTDDYQSVYKTLWNAEVPSIVIDDAQYLMANEFMRRAKETGFQKFTDIGEHFWQLLNIIKALPDNKIVYLMQHIDQDDTGREKAKTIGKLLDEKICIEGCFSIVLKSIASDGNYLFTTRTSGADAVKSPLGMFDNDEVDNDLMLVDNTIRDFYGLDAKPISASTKEGEKQDGN